MLETIKSISLSGTSKVTYKNDEVVAVQLYANISENGNSNINSTIVNQDAYDANKAVCRADIDAFTEEVRAIEDAQAE
jgi:hypothetical protein